VTSTEEPVDPPPDLESVFEEMRARARRQEGGDGREQYERALHLLEQGRVADALADLRAAARSPLYRFRASARLGRLHIGLGEVREGIEWLERAAEAPPPTADEGWAVLYDLGTVLQQVGEGARALAVFMELEADATSYRDVRDRVGHLSRAQAGKA
jgi:tetratricopeptide (TPR) repeat protein